MKALVAQTLAEVRMTLRRGETVLLTLIIPALLLVFLSKTHFTTSTGRRRIDFMAPGIIALCVISTSLVALSIATGFERSYGVLRRLRVTPLGQRRLLGSKIASVLVTQAIQVFVLGALALILGWKPHGGLGGGLLTVLLLVGGSAGCAGIGLFLAGRLRAEINLAAANGLYLVLLLGSGIVVPLQTMPGVVRHLAILTPSGAMAEGLHRILQFGLMPTWRDWTSVIAWAVLAPLLAARTFRFD
jgi:ABC-2 type transport system permease protein